MFTNMSAEGITMLLNSPSFFGGSEPGSRNGQIQSSPFGAIAENSIMFEQSPAKDGGQTITFSFSKTVYELSFTITDIDNGNDNQTGIIGASDLIVIVSPTTYTYTVPIGSSVIGNGTSVGTTTTSGPFRNTNDLNYDKSSPSGNIQISVPGPLTSLTFTLSLSTSQVVTYLTQQITIGSISFKDCGDTALHTTSPRGSPRGGKPPREEPPLTDRRQVPCRAILEGI